MEKGINFASKELEISLKKIITNANLPPCIVKNILANILIDVNSMEIKAIQKEQTEYEKELSKKVSKNKEKDE